MGIQRLIALVAATGYSSLSLAAAAAKAPTAAASVIQNPEPESREDRHCTGEGARRRWWRGAHLAKKSWLSDFALKVKQQTSSVGSNSNNRAKFAWRAYEERKSELTRTPDNARLQLETAEALLKWIRHTTNGNFPRVSEEGRVSDGDSPASRAIWRKHAPEALRLLKSGSTHALDSNISGGDSGAYDLAKVRERGGRGRRSDVTDIVITPRARYKFGDLNHRLCLAGLPTAAVFIGNQNVSAGCRHFCVVARGGGGVSIHT